MESLRRQLRYTQLALIACVLGVVAMAAAPNDVITAREVRIVSPNSQSELVLKADNNATGMWITDQQNRAGQVAIYHSGDQAVLGAYKAGQAGGKQFDAALASTGKGSVLTLAGSNQQKAINISPNNWQPQVQGDSDIIIRFIEVTPSTN